MLSILPTDKHSLTFHWCGMWGSLLLSEVLHLLEVNHSAVLNSSLAFLLLLLPQSAVNAYGTNTVSFSTVVGIFIVSAFTKLVV